MCRHSRPSFVLKSAERRLDRQVGESNDCHFLPEPGTHISAFRFLYSAFKFDRVEITDKTIIPGSVRRIGTESNRSSYPAHGNSRAGRPRIVVVIYVTFIING